MIKILLLATRNYSIEKIKSLLPPGVQVRSAILDGSPSIRFDTAFSPDIIIVQVDNVSRTKLYGLIDLRQNEAYRNLPLLVIGEERDRNVFEQNVIPGSDKRVNSFVPDYEIRAAISGIIDMRMMEERHILVVDDDPVILRSMRTYMEEQYKVTAVRSGKLAIKFLEKQKPDLIFLDYMMPEMDGISTFQVIRTMENGKKIPVIFLTGVNEKEKVMECLVLHPQGYLVKPVTKEAVLTKLKEVL